MKWEDISKRLPGRSAISCRLHYQNFLERRPEWDEERKNKLARLYERFVTIERLFSCLLLAHALYRFRKQMWEAVANELQMPWRAVEAMHWELGSEGIAQRAGVAVFSTIPSSTGASSLGAPTLRHAYNVVTGPPPPPSGYRSLSHAEEINEGQLPGHWSETAYPYHQQALQSNGTAYHTSTTSTYQNSPQSTQSDSSFHNQYHPPSMQTLALTHNQAYDRRASSSTIGSQGPGHVLPSLPLTLRSSMTSSFENDRKLPSIAMLPGRYKASQGDRASSSGDGVSG